MRFFTLLAIALLFFLTQIQATDYTYTPTVPAVQDHHWDNPLNWTPAGVPGAGDNVTISDSVYVSGSVTVNNVTLNGAGVIEAAGTLTIQGTFSWNNGALRGSGTVIISSGATVIVSGTPHKNLYQLTFENNGYLTWSGDGEIKLNNDAHIINKSSGTIEAQNNSRMDYVQKNHGGYLTNYGMIKKTASTGGGFSQTQIDPILINYGTMKVENGIMQIERGDSTTASNGIFDVAASCTLNFVDRPFRCDGATFTGSGVVQLVKDDTRPTFIMVGSGATFSANTTLRVNIDYNSEADGYIGGSGTLTVNGTFEWLQGGLFDTGNVVVNGSAIFSGSVGSRILKERTLTLKGTTTYSSSKGITFKNGGKIINDVSASFTKTTTAAWDSTTGIPSGTFENRGTFIYNNSGVMNMRVAVVNSGNLQILSGGTINFYKSLSNSASGVLSGVGTIDIKKSYTNAGSFTPGSSAGVLTLLRKPLSLASTSSVNIEIGGTTAGSDYDQLVASATGNAVLDGTLNISLINSFAPSAGQSFRILTFGGSRTGTFATVNQPQFQGSDMFTVQYGSNYVDLISNFDTSLPVELVAFTATGGYRQVALSWSTASEINNLGFEIYRSETEDGAYQMIANYLTHPELRGNGSGNTRRDYNFVDQNVADGKTYWYQLADVSFDGVRTFHPKVSVETAQQPNLIDSFVLSQNYPNPFNPETRFRFSQSSESRVRMAVYDLLGRRIRLIHDGMLAAGEHVFLWRGNDENGAQVSAGVYLLQVEVFAPDNGAVRFVDVRKMVLSK